MGSKWSKWLAASLAVTALAVVPAGAGAKLNYSLNSVDGQYLPAPTSVVGQINDVPPAGSPVSAKVIAPAAPVVVHTVQADAGFSWGDALVGAGAALLLALGGVAVTRRRHASPLAS